MYAIFEAGGHQHRAEVDSVVKIDRIKADVGDTVEFHNVLAVFDDRQADIGTPYVQDAKIVARVVQQGKDRKIRVLKYKPKKHYKRVRGHRQPFTQVHITDISA